MERCPGCRREGEGQELGLWFRVSAADYKLLWPVCAPALTLVWCLHTRDTWPEADPTALGWIPSPPALSCVAEPWRGV